MKCRTTAVLLCATLLLGGGCASEPPGLTPDEMIAAAEELDRQFVEAFNSGNAEALAALYCNSPDLVSFPPDTMEIRGFAAVTAAQVEGLATMPGARIELTDTYQLPLGDGVVGWGRYRVTATGPDGTEITMEGRFTDVKVQRDGRWVYLHEHASMPILPAPAPPPTGQ